MTNNWKKHLAKINENAKAKNLAIHKQAGHVLLAEAKENGLVCLGWDTYQKMSEPELGSIWTVSEMDGEKWLIVNTDDDGRIVRSLIEQQAEKERMQKTASVKEAIKTIPGDIVIIASPVSSINRKYTGIEGEVTAAYPERSKLSFQDGYTLWVENKDLKLVREASSIVVGDTIELKKNSLKGKVVGAEKDTIIFKSASGYTFKARIGEFDKIIKNGETVFISTDDPKSIFKFLYPPQKPEGGLGEPGLPEKMPPSIKANPSEEEMKTGESIPAASLTPPTIASMAAEEINLMTFGRVIHPGDRIMNKATGQEGIIEDIRVDRKLGKFYMVNYGGESVQEFETNLMKIPVGKVMERPGPIQGEPYLPKPHRSSLEKFAVGEILYRELTPDDQKYLREYYKELSPEEQETYKETLMLSHPNDDLSWLNEEKGIEGVASVKTAQGGPSLETLRGGGTSGPANVEPLTWEVHNTDTENKEDLINEALDEEMTEGALGEGKITIEIDPVTKSFNVTFPGQEGEENIPEEEEENINPQKAMPPSPGSPVQTNPTQGGGAPAQSAQEGMTPNSQVNF